MNIILSTERLVLRELENNDAEFILELLNTDSWLRYIGDRNVKSISDAINYIESGPRKSYQEHGFGLYLIELKDSTPIGLCGLLQREYLDNPDIGFALMPKSEGKGFAYEAVSATLAFARNNLSLKKILAITNLENAKSINLLKKIGLRFREEMTLNSGERVNLYCIKFGPLK